MWVNPQLFAAMQQWSDFFESHPGELFVSKATKFHGNSDHTSFSPFIIPPPGGAGRLTTAYAWKVDELTEDHDGAPDCYAPPAEYNKTSRAESKVNGIMPRDSIGNATNLDGAEVTKNKEGKVTKIVLKFDKDGTGNKFRWTSVVRKKVPPGGQADKDVDHRAFLRDTNNEYPVIRQSGPYNGFYIATTSIKASSGDYVNALEVPFGVRTAAIKKAGLDFGDYGAIINLASGAATGFVFCESNGTGHVREFSTKVIATMGDRKGPFLVMAFPMSAKARDKVMVDTVIPESRRLISTMNGSKFTNVADRITSDASQRNNMKVGLAALGYVNAL